ncbi:GNAT family N-acetyltransferase [Hoeflea sp.]|uniref:GNAT family N-acetyltransferase n=1 Tax=Hoeflea sp. TaxID=1940281 RepID=UPI0019AA31E0|nr:GNAT family N-acetyltransferase [Hoeflea sp.]MBC7282036.1 GNAT family N-acetyltransferase [Hoeflea sp.]
MNDIIIRQAVAADAARLNRALAQLSADMGDEHRATDADIARFCFGPAPVLNALLAVTEDGDIIGVAAYSPFFSTVNGAVGLYVSDLWVAEEARGKQLGQRLLAAVRKAGLEAWDAGFIRLGVYHDNPKAMAFYERLGFVPAAETQFMTLAGQPFDALGDEI